MYVLIFTELKGRWTNEISFSCLFLDPVLQGRAVSYHITEFRCVFIIFTLGYLDLV